MQENISYQLSPVSKYSYTINSTDKDFNHLVLSKGEIIICWQSEGKPFGLIENIWTHPDYRQKGYATRIIKSLLSRANMEDCYKVVLCCSDENTSLYKKCGFRVHQNAMRIDL